MLMPLGPQQASEDNAAPGRLPAEMRVGRRERPHPGVELRFTDINGHRFTCFATDARNGQRVDLELRQGRRARCEDRIRNAKDTGLRNLPLHGFFTDSLQDQAGKVVTFSCRYRWCATSQPRHYAGSASHQ
jgi:hypothetical protein